MRHRIIRMHGECNCLLTRGEGFFIIPHIEVINHQAQIKQTDDFLNQKFPIDRSDIDYVSRAQIKT